MKYAIAILALATLVVGCGPDVPIEEFTPPVNEPTHEPAAPAVGEGVTEMGAIKDGWSVSGFLSTGGVSVQTPNGSLSQQSLSLQCDFSIERNGPGAQYYTIEFNANAPGSGVFFAYADITASVQGNAVTRTISLVNGAVISLTGQVLRVVLRDGTPAELLTSLSLSPEAYYVSAQVTPGSRPSTQQPPRLLPMGIPDSVSHFPPIPGSYTIQHGDELLLPIDQNTGVSSVFITGSLLTAEVLNQGDISISFVMSPNATPIAVWHADLKDVQATWIPLPPGVSEIIVTNNDNAKEAAVNITLGVEG